MSFTALTVVGDGNGRVGYGYGKAVKFRPPFKRRWNRLSVT
jgi:ribosomal protein S5